MHYGRRTIYSWASTGAGQPRQIKCAKNFWPSQRIGQTSHTARGTIQCGLSFTTVINGCCKRFKFFAIGWPKIERTTIPHRFHSDSHEFGRTSEFRHRLPSIWWCSVIFQGPWDLKVLLDSKWGNTHAMLVTWWNSTSNNSAFFSTFLFGLGERSFPFCLDAPPPLVWVMYNNKFY